MIKGISIFLPAYNDEKTIEKLVLDAISVLEPLSFDYEIIIIDDASKDATGKVAERLVKNYRKVRLLQHKKNRDYGGVLKTGFANAAKEWVFYTDGDGQYDIKEIIKLLPYAGEYDLINGYILKRNDSNYRMLFGRMYQFLLDICFGKTLKYVNCDFRLIKKAAIDRVEINSNSGFAPAEMVIKLTRNGIKVKQILINHFARKYGHSQFLDFKKIFNLSKDMLKFLIQK